MPPGPDTNQSGVINTFSRFALPVVWDFAESVTTSTGSGSYGHSLEWIGRFLDINSIESGKVKTVAGSVLGNHIEEEVDIIITDPPYYDAIPYSDLMDFFYVWLRRSTHGLSPEIDTAFQEPLGPKWNHDTGDGELIDDASRFDGDRARSKQNYEDGMARAFQACHCGAAIRRAACRGVCQ